MAQKEREKEMVKNGVVVKKSVKADIQRLLDLEAQYCSYGDTVHYADEIKIFDRSEGIYVYDKEGVEYLDMQMWYSAVNFGYANKRLNNALKKQIDKLPQARMPVSP